MTVLVEDCLPGELWRLKIWGLFLEKFAQKQGLAGQNPGPRIVGKQVQQLISEDGSATWLQNDDRNFFLNYPSERVEYSQKLTLGAMEHAEIVERASAAQTSF